jgi:hypothetical protein
LSSECDEARRHFSECAGCRERWRQMSRLIDELENADVERREVLAGIGEPTPRDIERAYQAGVTAGVASASAAVQRPSRARPRLALLCTAAAALLCAAFFVVRAWTGERDKSGVGPMLGTNDYAILDGDGVLDADGVTIQYPPRSVPSFRIELEGWSSEGKPVSWSDKIWEARWRPDPKLLERFTGKVMLRVQPLTVDGSESGRAVEREFSLSR